jgi:predicted nicotinamide N-methyase
VPRPVRTHPLFFARLHLALLGLADAIDSEVEYVGNRRSLNIVIEVRVRKQITYA